MPWDPDAYKTGRIEFMEDEWLDGVATSQRFLDSAPSAITPSASMDDGESISTAAGVTTITFGSNPTGVLLPATLWG